MEQETVVEEKLHDRGSVAGWLKQKMALAPPERIRVSPQVFPDRRAHPGMDAGTKVLEAWGNTEWWYSRLVVEIYVAMFPTGKQAQWLLLGSADIAGVVEGQWPGQPFVNVWEDMQATWLDLAKAAANEAEETLQALREVSVAWRNGNASSSPQPSSGS